MKKWVLILLIIFILIILFGSSYILFYPKKVSLDNEKKVKEFIIKDLEKNSNNSPFLFFKDYTDKLEITKNGENWKVFAFLKEGSYEVTINKEGKIVGMPIAIGPA